jgi:UDP-glucose 4-epimerase
MGKAVDKTIIVFGATGAIGAYATIHLLDKGYSVIAVGRRISDNDFFAGYNCKYISVDIENKLDFAKLPMENVGGVIHLAGYLPAIMEGYDPKRYIDVNISGTLNILEYAAKLKIDLFVYSTSFSDVSYLWNRMEPISADAIIRFPMNNDHSIYSITKNTGADIVRHYSSKFGFSHFILRFPNIYLYHPNIYYYVDGISRRKGLFNIIDEAERGEDIELWGSAGRLRDMVYVKDCCQIIEKCITYKNMGVHKCWYRCWNYT